MTRMKILNFYFNIKCFLPLIIFCFMQVKLYLKFDLL